MNAAKLREILKTEYGIKTELEFDAAVKKMSGINLGIFTTPLDGRSETNEQKTEASACA